MVHSFQPRAIVAVGVGVLGPLMVSQVPYRSFKELDLRHSYGTLVIVVFVLALLVQEPSVTFFAIALGYALSGPAEWLWRRYTHRPLEATTHAEAAERPAQG